MSRRYQQLAALMFALAWFGTACGYSQNNPLYPSMSTVSVLGVKVTPQSIQFTSIGETRDVTATVSPSNATDQTVTWTSSNPDVATVDATGRVTAVAVGFNVFITATTHDGKYQASVAVNVNP